MTQTCPNCSTANRTTARFCWQCGTSLPGKAKSASPGTGLLPPQSILSGRYVIVNRIGQGGMAAVYKATDLRIPGKVWAVKEMSDVAITNPQEKQEALEAFKHEAELLSNLNHPGIPRVTDFFSEGGKQYLVMEFVDGETLEEKLNKQGGPFSEAEVLAWAEQLGDVLAYLHAQTVPIIFRDLKPGNVMIDQNDRIKLIDFGIARFFQPGRVRDTVTFGTDGYAPIEQYGQGQTDARSDIYALGATLYALLTNQVPPTSVDRLAKMDSLTPLRQLNAKVSPAVEQTVLKALELEPDQRFQTVDEFWTALVGQDSTTLKPRPVSPPVPSSPTLLTQLGGFLQGSGMLALAGVGVLVLILVGCVLALTGIFGRAQPTTATAITVITREPTTPVPTPTEPIVTRVHTSTPLSANNTSVPTRTPTPTYTPKSPTTTPTPTRALPTPTRPTATPRPTPTPSCSRTPQGEFASLWQNHKEKLGCPKETNPLYGQFTEMPFERGHLFWLRDIDIYGQSRQVIVKVGGQNEGDTGTWFIHEENWSGEGICGVPSPPREGLFLPDRELAKVWCEVDGLNLLGYALAPKEYTTPSRGIAAVQNFDKAVILKDSDGHTKGLVYVFFWADSSYIRFRFK